MPMAARHRWLRVLLVRYRRPLAALCAFFAVLMALSSIRTPPRLTASGHSSNLEQSAPALATLVERGLVAAPVRLADAEVAGLLHAGSMVDVVAADGEGRARVIAPCVEVADVPTPAGDGFASTSFEGALVLFAVTSAQATELAGAAAAGPISVVLCG